MEASGLFPELTFKNTVASQDFSKKKQKPDISIYWKLPDNYDSERDLDFKAADLWIENKNEDDDIFLTLAELRDEEVDGDLESHIRWTNSAYETCAQLINYTITLHHSQFRVFSFGVFLFGEKGRLLRWDRSGAVYTEAFQWRTQPDILCEFFGRLNFLSPVDRGCDTTVTAVMADDDEAKAALSKLRTYEGWKDCERLEISNLYRFLVYADRATDGKHRSYITPGAIWYTN